MTLQNFLNDIIKISASDLNKYQSILGKAGYSLDEILEYDDGRSYQTWSTPNGFQIVLDVSCKPNESSENIISELIDCWLELRAIRNILEPTDDFNFLSIVKKPLPYEQFKQSIQDIENDIEIDKAMFQLIFKGEIDTTLLTYYTLDEDIKKGILQ